MMVELTIGKLAQVAGVNIETIRYYQRLGLLDEPPKPPSGYRRYAPDQAERVRFIKRAQTLGFTLDEVSTLLVLDSACDCSQTRAMAARKQVFIGRKIANLAALHQALGELIHRCDVGGTLKPCPIINALSQD